MNGEQNSAKNPGRRISMELTADAARVTSLSLSGNRLVVTIEAELADSQMHAVEAAAASPSPDSGAALSNQMLYSRPGYPTPNDTQPILGMDVVASPIDETETDTLNVDSFPPMEPVRELTDTWDTPASNAQAAQGGSGQHPWSAVPAPEPVPAPVPAPTPVALAEPEKDEQDHLETRDDEILYGNESARKCAEPAPPPAVPPAPAPVPAPAPIPTPVLLQPEPPKQETFAPAVIQAPVDEPLAIAEESSAIGGERHGEPQPAISFGLDSFSGVVPPPLPTPPPECKPAPAPIVTPPAPAPEAPKAEAGGTTVLIRYTCPKCKTQGMQAVDKVGTVVNCSNCGKAMRLVMKK